MEADKSLFYQTPDGSHFICQHAGKDRQFVTIVSKSKICPMIQRLLYWPGLLYAYGAIPAKPGDFWRAFDEVTASLKLPIV